MEELLRVLLFIGDDWAEDHHDLERRTPCCQAGGPS
jgi:hypothetical protein